MRILMIAVVMTLPLVLLAGAALGMGLTLLQALWMALAWTVAAVGHQVAAWMTISALARRLGVGEETDDDDDTDVA